LPLLLYLQRRIPPSTRNYFANFALTARTCNPFPHIQLQTTLQMYQNKGFTVKVKAFALIQLQTTRHHISSNPIKFSQIQTTRANTPGVGG
jgi:hypothetical protein